MSRRPPKNFIKAITKGLLKVMSKMGISTYQSYCGAQIFDAIGLSSEFVDRYFTGTATMVEGVGVGEVARETVARHRDAFGSSPVYRNMLDVGGEYAYRLRGEAHSWKPDTIAKLQHAARSNAPATYREYAALMNDQTSRLMTLRGLFDLKAVETPVPIEEVEPANEIVKRFATGAMSFGSISREAHTTLAIAMNRIGGRSNTGEGGEEPDRYKPLANGDSMRSRHQAGRVRPVRRHHRVSGQCGRHPDQDGPGREARRRRPAARPQGRQGDRRRCGIRRRASA